MIHFTRRRHLIDWLLRNCTRRVVVRAMEEGTVEHLGSFRHLGPAPTQAGWAVRVTSERGKVWVVEVVSRLKAGGFGVFIVDWEEGTSDPVLWQHWQGDADHKLGVPQELYDLWEGDNPIEYSRLRKAAKDD